MLRDITAGKEANFLTGLEGVSFSDVPWQQASGAPALSPEFYSRATARECGSRQMKIACAPGNM
jgi:outer membrane PBP1 activator LpoA protein